MNERYIELDDVCHLNDQASGGGPYDNKLWRESYYFNVSDKRSGISLISTIGILPNRKMITGFFLFLKGKKIIRLKPLISYKKPVFNDFSFYLKGLEYIIEGTNWRLIYDSPKFKFNILFKPLNKFYPYITSRADIVFARIGSQHLEQFGVFEGELKIGSEKIVIGPSLGHRDHSWGIRDWCAVDRYRLYCCAFSKDFAFNLWEGSIDGMGFFKGYIFDGNANVPIVKYDVKTCFSKNGKEPRLSEITIIDEKGCEYKIGCRTLVSIPVPPRKSIMYETLAEMRSDGNKGRGLQELLFHEPNPVNRFWHFLKLITMI